MTRNASYASSTDFSHVTGPTNLRPKVRISRDRNEPESDRGTSVYAADDQGAAQGVDELKAHVTELQCGCKNWRATNNARSNAATPSNNKVQTQNGIKFILVRDQSFVRLCFVGLTLLASSSALVAQQPSEPKYPRFDFTPLFGYRSSMSIGVEPQVSGANPRVVLDSDPSYGFAFGARFNEEDVIEFRWAKQDSHVHVEDFGAISSRQRITLNQFHGDFTHEYFLDEWPAWARPYVIGSVGATRLSGAGNDFTRFSFGIGGGVKLFAGQHVGLRLQAQWVPILVSPDVAFVCGAGCIVRIGGNLGSQGEFVVGPVFRF